MNPVLRYLLSKTQGAKRFQGFFAQLHQIALTGMNYGCGGGVETSGELGVIDLLSRHFANECATVFDVGANRGDYSFALRGRWQSRLQLYAFEPSANVYAQLNARLTGNDIQLFPLGFSDAPGTRIIFAPRGLTVLGSVYRRRLEHFGLDQEPQGEITLDTIDAFCMAHGINRIHFLKLDIEGHEFAALRGAQRMLAERRIDCIQFEFGGCNIDARVFWQDLFYLLNDDFQLFRVLRDGLQRIAQYEEQHEIFLTTNFLAVRRDTQLALHRGLL